MSEASPSKLNTALLGIVIVLLLWDLFWNPQRQPSGRFQRLDTPRMALDTKTGRLCATVASTKENTITVPLSELHPFKKRKNLDKEKGELGFIPDPYETAPPLLPLCSDLK